MFAWFYHGHQADLETLASEFDDEEESDVGFSQDKDLKPAKKSYEVDHKVFSPADIQLHQDKQIDEVSAILGQPSEASAILLRYLRWNKERLVEAYMDKPDAILESAGLGPDAAQTPRTKVIKGFTCDICCEDTPGLETYALKCGHRYCTDCYRQYLAQKIKDEGEAARIQCPTRGCHRIVDAKSLDLLVAEELKSRYSDRLKWRASLIDMQIPSASHTYLCRRQRESEVVPGPQLRVCHRMRGQKEGSQPSSPYSRMLVQTSLLLWLHPERPSTGTVLTGQAMDQEMRR